MKQHSKLSQNQQHEEIQCSATRAAKEFASSDELLRFDAAQTAVPPEIARRLKASTHLLSPQPTRSWWKQILGH